MEINLRRFSVDEYFRMCNEGFFPPEERTELIEGQIVLKMAQNPPHIGGITLATEVLMQALGTTHRVVPGGTVRLTHWSAPDPDFAVISRERWRPGQPLTTGDLFVEVSDTSLSFDRRHKASLYALASIAEYWVINLVDRQVEVHRDPEPTPEGLYKALYRTVSVHAAGTSIAPLCRPDACISVSDLLPDPYTPEQPA